MSLFNVHIIDVGQGDSILLEGPDGDTILIDSGPEHYNGEPVIDYLDEHNISYLDHFVSTHYDADHIGGHTAIIEHLGHDRVEEIHGPNMSGVSIDESNASEVLIDYKEYLKKHEIVPNTLQSGSDELSADNIAIDILNPSPEIDSGSKNENSIVMQCTYGEQSVLLAGDIKTERETELARKHHDSLSSTDVLKASHHGSKYGTSAELLMTCDPEIVCFSHGNAHSKHPHDTTLSRTNLHDTDAVSTAVHGSTTFALDGKEMIAVEHERDIQTYDTADVTALIHAIRENGREQFDPASGVDPADLPEDVPTWATEASIVGTTETVGKETAHTNDPEKEVAATASLTETELLESAQKYAEANDMPVTDVLQSLRQTAIAKGMSTPSAEQNGTVGEEGHKVLEGIRSASVEDEEAMSASEGLNNRPDDDDDGPSLSP
ncbi:ComEC/Rec2 family competence protein [Halocatena pleomorpha]|uniref:MBL fold metallo-hydrolase n=1 Tax=Halocatena pleomorpha TaxID=1785090 RepID=A0A3P3R5Y0_9EURY|nr:MBL fold metallo-hydrolase [Halocatena pleomorpha]RRJ28785.1 MBL fold metallo-hydrolase [Halocatena pleomorpha]